MKISSTYTSSHSIAIKKIKVTIEIAFSTCNGMSTFTRALHAAGDALSTAGNWCRPEIITKNAGNPQTVVQGETRRALALRRIRAEGHPKKRADDDNAAQTEKESAQIVSSLAIVISVIIEFVKVNLKMLHNCFVCGSACIGC